MSTLEKDELRNLLIKNWMTHDAMWFANCYVSCGIEKTNEINKAAVKGMAMVEIKRMKKALGFGDIRSFADLEQLVNGAISIMLGDFLDFHVSFPEKNVMRADMRRCFAYEGVSALGAIDGYQCGIFDRIDGWFESLEIPFDVNPQIDGCLMHTEGRCIRDHSFTFAD